MMPPVPWKKKKEASSPEDVLKALDEEMGDPGVKTLGDTIWQYERAHKTLADDKVVKKAMEVVQANFAMKKGSYGLEPSRDFPGGLTPENADIWHSILPQGGDRAKLFAQHARNMQKQTLMALQVASADATVASEAAFRANEAVMRVMRKAGGPKFPVAAVKPLPGEPWYVGMQDQKTRAGMLVGRPPEGVKLDRLLHWFEKYPHPPDPNQSKPKCGEKAPMMQLKMLDVEGKTKPEVLAQTGDDPTKKVFIDEEGYQELNPGICKIEDRFKCPPSGKCFCACSEPRKEDLAYGHTYGKEGTGPDNGEPPVPFLRPGNRWLKPSPKPETATKPSMIDTLTGMGSTTGSMSGGGEPAGPTKQMAVSLAICALATWLTAPVFGGAAKPTKQEAVSAVPACKRPAAPGSVRRVNHMPLRREIVVNAAGVALVPVAVEPLTARVSCGWSRDLRSYW